MFTGIIEHIGNVKSIATSGEGCDLVVDDAGPILMGCRVNDSIAVNGVCLTVTALESEKGVFQAWVSNETLKRTNLGELNVGSKVNLERAMQVGARLGGHIVQGHVDSTAKLLERVQDGESQHLMFQLPEPTPGQSSLLPYVIEKGSVTIDGVSLTITTVDDSTRRFGVMLIPHTQKHTTLGEKPLNASVNLEVDMVGKYIEKNVLAALEGRGGDLIAAFVEKKVLEVLAKKGF